MKYVTLVIFLIGNIVMVARCKPAVEVEQLRVIKIPQKYIAFQMENYSPEARKILERIHEVNIQMGYIKPATVVQPRINYESYFYPRPLLNQYTGIPSGASVRKLEIHPDLSKSYHVYSTSIPYPYNQQTYFYPAPYLQLPNAVTTKQFSYVSSQPYHQVSKYAPIYNLYTNQERKSRKENHKGHKSLNKSNKMKGKLSSSSFKTIKNDDNVSIVVIKPKKIMSSRPENKAIINSHLNIENKNKGVSSKTENFGHLKVPITKFFGMHNKEQQETIKEALRDGGVVIQRLRVRNGGIAIAGPGGVATAGSGGTAIVGPGGVALTHPRGLAIAGPGARVISIPDTVDLKKLALSSDTKNSIPREGRIVATGPVIYYNNER